MKENNRFCGVIRRCKGEEGDQLKGGSDLVVDVDRSRGDHGGEGWMDGEGKRESMSARGEDNGVLGFGGHEERLGLMDQGTAERVLVY